MSETAQRANGFVISDTMQTAACSLIEAFDEFHLRRKQTGTALISCTPEQLAYSAAIEKLNNAVYAANPHLDPDSLRNPDGSTKHVERLELQRASAGPRNDLLEAAAREAGKKNPEDYRIFEVAPQRSSGP